MSFYSSFYNNRTITITSDGNSYWYTTYNTYYYCNKTPEPPRAVLKQTPEKMKKFQPTNKQDLPLI